MNVNGSSKIPHSPQSQTRSENNRSLSGRVDDAAQKSMPKNAREFREKTANSLKEAKIRYKEHARSSTLEKIRSYSEYSTQDGQYTPKDQNTFRKRKSRPS